MSARTLHPSDVVVRRDSDRNGITSTLRKLGVATDFRDRVDESNRDGEFTCRYVWTGIDAWPNPEAREWTLMTQGADVGGRRYRRMLTLAEAQQQALAWLDRRFAAVDAVTGEPVKA